MDLDRILEILLSCQIYFFDTNTTVPSGAISLVREKETLMASKIITFGGHNITVHSSKHNAVA